MSSSSNENDFNYIDTYEKYMMVMVLNYISDNNMGANDYEECSEYLMEEPSRSKEFFCIDDIRYAIKVLSCIICKKRFAFPGRRMYHCTEENHENCGYCGDCYLSEENKCKNFHIDTVSNIYEEFGKIPEKMYKMNLDNPEDKKLYEFLTKE